MRIPRSPVPDSYLTYPSASDFFPTAIVSILEFLKRRTRREVRLSFPASNPAAGGPTRAVPDGRHCDRRSTALPAGWSARLRAESELAGPFSDRSPACLLPPDPFATRERSCPKQQRSAAPVSSANTLPAISAKRADGPCR